MSKNLNKRGHLRDRRRWEDNTIMDFRLNNHGLKLIRCARVVVRRQTLASAALNLVSKSFLQERNVKINIRTQSNKHGDNTLYNVGFEKKKINSST